MWALLPPVSKEQQAFSFVSLPCLCDRVLHLALTMAVCQQCGVGETPSSNSGHAAEPTSNRKHRGLGAWKYIDVLRILGGFTSATGEGIARA